MRVKELHPLCCISLETAGIGDASPDVQLSRARSMPAGALGVSGGSDGIAARAQPGSESAVAGMLYKWTNYGRGWRLRWFLLQNGVLSYSKIRRSDSLNLDDDVRLIGDVSAGKLLRADGGSCRRKRPKTLGIVQLKISSFRESKSDERRFYIFTATKTLHLRTDSKSDRVAWIQALVSARYLLPSRSLKDEFSPLSSDLSISTETLRKRLIQEGLCENAVKDCEQIVLSEFSEVQGQLKLVCEERSHLLDTLRQLEAANLETAAPGIHDGEFLLPKHEFSRIGRAKFCECSTTESSDDIEKQEAEELSDEDDALYFDTEEYFRDQPTTLGNVMKIVNETDGCKGFENQHSIMKGMHSEEESCDAEKFSIKRRTKLPDPVEKERGVSLWSLIKDNVGKDLTRVCLPVYFNEPLSSLQKCFEDFEYSHLLDEACDHGKAGNSLLRALKVAAFAISGYASSKGRHCKPFNPLLGETYEADYPEKGVRFFSEKVSHHPTLIACQCEGRGWKFWGDSNLRTKFWGQTIQLDPVGVLTLEFDDGEIFHWNKVTTSINNLILGKLYCDHHGVMNIRGNREYSCKMKFKEPSLFDRNPHQVHGFVEDVTGRKVATIVGKWDEALYYIDGEGTSKLKNFADATLLWKCNKPPPTHTRYNMSSFAITLNELTLQLQEKLPPTDSRLRPDQRHLENGEYEKANAEKQRLEKRQRMSRQLQEKGWKPRWFQREGEDGPFRYVGGYWEARERCKWNECPNIFGEFCEDIEKSTCKSQS